MVRPHLEYGCAVWDPFTNKDINTLEAVQNKAARFVQQDYSRDSSVSQMKEQMEWRPLQERRFVARQKAFFKTVNELHAVPTPPYLNIQSRYTRQQHPLVFNTIRTEVDIYRFAYFPRTVRVWNLLPVEIVTAPSVDCFAARLNTAITQGRIVIIYPRSQLYLGSGPGLGLSADRPLYVY